MNRLWIKSFALLVLLSVQPAKADYSYDTPLSSPADSTDSTFSIDSNDTSCSSGGGSTPSLWVGASNGNGRTSVNDYDGTRKDDSFFTGTIGINIPLGMILEYNKPMHICSYKTKEDGVVFGVNNMLVANADMDKTKVYKITKAIYSNMSEFRKINAYAKQINVDNSLKLRIPLHPGAQKYFDER